MSDPVRLSSSGPPETVLDEEPADALARLEAAITVEEIAAVCADYPRCLAAWADLGDALGEPALAYAAYRTGYHRGLDRLRANGWRGSGWVRWQHPSNRGFLRALTGLQRTAQAIGEADEEQRCALFLLQLDPSWPPSGLGDRA